MKKSIRNFLKRKSQEPRKMDEIQKAYGQLLSAAGQANYLVYVHTNELKRINTELESINKEAAERQKLDREAQVASPVEAPKVAEEVKNG